jgi:hypothetical protein
MNHYQLDQGQGHLDRNSEMWGHPFQMETFLDLTLVKKTPETRWNHPAVVYCYLGNKQAQSVVVVLLYLLSSIVD